MKKIKNLLLHWFELLIGALILIYAEDIRWFLFYILILLILKVDFLRKMIRVFQVSNEVKILAILRKLNVSDEEVGIVMDSVKQKINQEDWESLEKDFRDITNN